jgi:AraC-like DNA-binding protein
MEAISNKHAVHPFMREPAAMKKIRDAVWELKRKDLNAIEQTGYLHVILGTVLRYISFENGGPDENTDLPARILLYVNKHFKEELSTEQIAHAMGYSSNYLAERFRSGFHIGISRYINTVRLKNALTLLREKKKNITECAMESGFSSLRTFYRVFTEEIGCTPREYLKNE